MKLDFLIIGAGPAGLGAALYAARAGLKVAIIEKGPLGGKIIKTHQVDNYLGLFVKRGYELADEFIKHVKEEKVEFISDKVVKIKNIKSKIKKVYLEFSEIIETKTILIATGMKANKLNVKGYDDFFGKGISTCLVCDGPLFKNKIIAVVGGGTSAVEEAIYASNQLKKIFIINKFNKFNIQERMLKILKQKKNIKVFYNTEILEIKGKENVESILISKGDKKETLQVNGVFTYVGWNPEIDFLDKENSILNKKGYVIVDSKTQQTKINGVYAAGDIVQKEFNQISIAVAEGNVAALSAKRYIDLQK